MWALTCAFRSSNQKLPHKMWRCAHKATQYNAKYHQESKKKHTANHKPPQTYATTTHDNNRVPLAALLSSVVCMLLLLLCVIFIIVNIIIIILGRSPVNRALNSQKTSACAYAMACQYFWKVHVRKRVLMIWCWCMHDARTKHVKHILHTTCMCNDDDDDTRNHSLSLLRCLFGCVWIFSLCPFKHVRQTRMHARSPVRPLLSACSCCVRRVHVYERFHWENVRVCGG